MLSDFLFRLRALFQRKTVESELDQELRAHLENEVEKYQAAGLLGPYYQDIDVFAPLVLDSYLENGNVRAGTIRVEIVGACSCVLQCRRRAGEKPVLHDEPRGLIKRTRCAV